MVLLEAKQHLAIPLGDNPLSLRNAVAAVSAFTVAVSCFAYGPILALQTGDGRSEISYVPISKSNQKRQAP